MKKFKWCIVVLEKTGWDAGEIEVVRVFPCSKDFSFEDFGHLFPDYMNPNKNYIVKREILEPELG